MRFVSSSPFPTKHVAPFLRIDLFKAVSSCANHRSGKGTFFFKHWHISSALSRKSESSLQRHSSVRH